jgi:hypothetical protein
MRFMVVMLAVVVGCKSGSKQAEPPPAKSERPTKSAPAPHPTVARASVLAGDDGPPPLLVILDETGGLTITAVDRWSDLAKELPASATSNDLDTIHKIILQASNLGQTPKQVMAEMDKEPELLAPSVPSDDPGTGTAMTLEEGKMGNPGDKPPAEDPTLVKRRQALPFTGWRGPLDIWGTLIEPGANDPPSRVAKIAGEVVTDGKLLDQRAAILASPRTKATKLIEALESLEAAIVVGHDRTIRPLRINFRGERDLNAPTPPEPRWIEARLSASGITIEAVPGTPALLDWGKSPLDQPRFEAILTGARKSGKLDPRAPVDVLVDDDVDVQRLVDLIVALDSAGVTMIGLGPARRR